jgi:hypothetical protein
VSAAALSAGAVSGAAVSGAAVSGAAGSGGAEDACGVAGVAASSLPHAATTNDTEMRLAPHHVPARVRRDRRLAELFIFSPIFATSFGRGGSIQQ